MILFFAIGALKPSVLLHSVCFLQSLRSVGPVSFKFSATNRCVAAFVSSGSLSFDSFRKGFAMSSMAECTSAKKNPVTRANGCMVELIRGAW